MENLIIITESDFKKWVKEAVNECILETKQAFQENPKAVDGLLNREEIAKFLRISLVTPYRLGKARVAVTQTAGQGLF